MRPGLGGLADKDRDRTSNEDPSTSAPCAARPDGLAGRGLTRVRRFCARRPRSGLRRPAGRRADRGASPEEEHATPAAARRGLQVMAPLSAPAAAFQDRRPGRLARDRGLTWPGRAFTRAAPHRAHLDAHSRSLRLWAPPCARAQASGLRSGLVRLAGLFRVLGNVASGYEIRRLNRLHLWPSLRLRTRLDPKRETRRPRRTPRPSVMNSQSANRRASAVGSSLARPCHHPHDETRLSPRLPLS